MAGAHSKYIKRRRFVADLYRTSGDVGGDCIVRWPRRLKHIQKENANKKRKKQKRKLKKKETQIKKHISNKSKTPSSQLIHVYAI